jgi:hypothetical protein
MNVKNPVEVSTLYIETVFEADVGGAPRGREKRRELLAYLREHPEELRPVTRKLL